MKTVEENRLDWLIHLIKQHGSIAELNIKLARDRTDATLSQIKNQSIHHKTKKPRTMGSDVARDIEEKLGLERGLLDNPFTYSEPFKKIQLVAAEESAPYHVMGSWPFKTIDQAQWLSIPEAARDMLEQQINSLIPKTAKTNKAA